MNNAVRRTHYSLPLQLMHWLVAGLILSQIAVAGILTQLRSLHYGQELLSVHRQTGFAILLLILVQFAMSRREAVTAPSIALPAWQISAARLVHGALFLALTVQPLLGIVVAWGRGDTVTLFGLVTVPAPWDVSDRLRDDCMLAHMVTAGLIVGLVAVHIGAVVFNHRRRHFPVLERMLPSGPDNTLVNRVPVRAQLLAALGFITLISLGTGVNAVLKYRDLIAMTAHYQETEQAAAGETQQAQVSWKELVGLAGGGGAGDPAHMLELAQAAKDHLDAAATALGEPATAGDIRDASARIQTLLAAHSPPSADAIKDLDSRLQDLVDSQAATAQQRPAEISERASQGHDLIVISVAPAVLCGIVLALLLARSISSSLSRMRSIVRSVAENAAGQEVVVRGQGEFAGLMRDMVTMRDAVRSRMQQEANERLALETKHREMLEVRVQERTAQLSQKTSDINAMLQNMKLGVSTVIPGNRIHPEYSNYLRTIFCIDDLANKDLIESLFSRSSLGADAKDQVHAALAAILGEEPLMFDFNSHLLAREMTLANDDGSQKIVLLDWSPIINEESGTVEKVLLITQDVTQLRELELASAKQKEELDIIAKIIRVPAGKFNDFVESARGFMAANRTLIGQQRGRDHEPIAALFRNMHTVKGNARTFEFSQITDAAHRAEQTYDRLRRDANAAWDAPLMLSELEAVEAAIARFVGVNEEKLGRKGRAAELLTSRGCFVGNDELAKLRAMTASLAATHPGAVTARLRKAVDELGLISLERLVSGSVDALASLAAELKKPTPAVDVAHGGFGFNNQFAEALKSSFVHILRNSLDHGIESPEERRAASKPEQGCVRFSCVRRADRIELRISDDGRGLALHRLYEKGLAAGLFDGAHRPTREQVADLIFRSGLSTATAVTQVSGRGVGMDAVRTFLKQQGATIRIELLGSAADFAYTPFEFVIEVPATACAHSRAVAA